MAPQSPTRWLAKIERSKKINILLRIDDTLDSAFYFPHMFRKKWTLATRSCSLRQRENYIYAKNCMQRILYSLKEINIY